MSAIKLTPLASRPMPATDAPAAGNGGAPFPAALNAISLNGSLGNAGLILKKHVSQTPPPANSGSDQKKQPDLKKLAPLAKPPLSAPPEVDLGPLSSPSSRTLTPLANSAAAAAAPSATVALVKPLASHFVPKTPNTARTPLKTPSGSAAPVLFALPQKASTQSLAINNKASETERSLFGANGAPAAGFMSAIFAPILNPAAVPQPSPSPAAASGSATPALPNPSPDDLSMDTLNL